MDRGASSRPGGDGCDRAQVQGAERKSIGLAEAMKTVASESKCHFFDADSVTSASKVDGVHLDKDQHCRLGLALAVEVRRILQRAER